MSNKIGVAILDAGGTFQLATCHPDYFDLDSSAYVILNNNHLANLDFGSFYDDADQALVSTLIPQVITINHTTAANNISIVAGSQLTFPHRGTYNIQISIQITNNNTQPKDAVIWIRKNGTDVPLSASTVTVNGTHGGVKGHYVFMVNYVDNYSAGDFIQFYWVGNSTDLSIETLPDSVVAPVYPASPSVILTATKVL